MSEATDFLDSIKCGIPLQKSLNYKKIPVTRIKANYEGMLLFNSLIEYAKSQEDVEKIIRTPSGGISVQGIVKYPSYDITPASAGVELVLLLETGTYRIIFTNIDKKGDTITMYGNEAFNKFKNICEKFDIDIESYAIENGIEYKEKIEKPYIALTEDCIAGMTYDNVHHIDIHSAWPSNLCKAYPEFYPVFNYLYENRKEVPEYKAVMNESIGFMQSLKMCKAKWAYLSMEAINGCNRQIEDLTRRLKLGKRKILCYNTDGIWYQGKIFHDKDEGPNMGQWHNDYVNCYFRARSAGAYEFMDEDCNINIRLRGNCELDKYKNREDWEWDDLFQPQALVQTFFYDKDKECIVYEKEK